MAGAESALVAPSLRWRRDFQLIDALDAGSIAGSTATVSGLQLTAESLAGRRNRISTVTVRRLPETSAGSAAGAAGREGNGLQRQRSGQETTAGQAASAAQGAGTTAADSGDDDRAG